MNGLDLILLMVVAVSSVHSNQIDYLPNSLIQDFITHIQSDRKDSFEQASPENILFDTNVS